MGTIDPWLLLSCVWLSCFATQCTLPLDCTFIYCLRCSASLFSGAFARYCWYRIGSSTVAFVEANEGEYTENIEVMVKRGCPFILKRVRVFHGCIYALYVAIGRHYPRSMNSYMALRAMQQLRPRDDLLGLSHVHADRPPTLSQCRFCVLLS